MVEGLGIAIEYQVPAFEFLLHEASLRLFTPAEATNLLGTIESAVAMADTAPEGYRVATFRVAAKALWDIMCLPSGLRPR